MTRKNDKTHKPKRRQPPMRDLSPRAKGAKEVKGGQPTSNIVKSASDTRLNTVRNVRS